jgi:hypothetical protein
LRGSTKKSKPSAVSRLQWSYVCTVGILGIFDLLIFYANGENDLQNDYQMLCLGWHDDDRIHRCLIHIQIKGRKIWIAQSMSNSPADRPPFTTKSGNYSRSYPRIRKPKYRTIFNQWHQTIQDSLRTNG